MPSVNSCPPTISFESGAARAKNAVTSSVAASLTALRLKPPLNSTKKSSSTNLTSAIWISSNNVSSFSINSSFVVSGSHFA